jgi:transposase
LEPGAVVAEVARRRQVCPQQIFTWRREMRGAPSEPSGFVPILAEAPAVVPTPPSSMAIEVKLAGAVLRVAPGTDVGLLTAVLRAIRGSAV